MTKLAVALAFLALNFYTYNFLARKAVIPERESFASFPRQLEGGWVCSDSEPMEQKVVDELGVTDYLLCDAYNQELDAVANVYVGYHASQIREDGGGKENSIHPPAHCLPGSGWDIIRNETVPIDMPGIPGGHGTAKRLLIAKGESRQLVYYWYQSRGKAIAQDWLKILHVGIDRARLGRTDGALVRFSMPVIRSDEARADAAFRSLATQVVAKLPPYVPE